MCQKTYTEDAIRQMQDIETLCRVKQLFNSEGWQIVRSQPMYDSLPDVTVLCSLVQREAMRVTVEQFELIR